MSVDRDRFARSGWLVSVVVAVPLLGVVDAIGPQPFAALGFVANLTVLGVAGGRALLGRTGLSAVERAAAALRLHLDRQLWAGLVALTAEAAAAGVLSRRGHPGEPRNPRWWRTATPLDGNGILWGGSLAAAGAVLSGAVTLSVWTAAHQAYPAFSALSAIRVAGAERLVRIELTSEETAPTRFIVRVAVGRAKADSITLRLAPGVTWRETVPAPRSAAVTVVAYRGTRSRAPYRQVHLVARGNG
jgi:hypothetical protein